MEFTSFDNGMKFLVKFHEMSFPVAICGPPAYRNTIRNWAGLVCGFVGSWVALGFVWVSFPRATCEGFSFSRLTAGAKMSHPRPSAVHPDTIRTIETR